MKNIKDLMGELDFDPVDLKAKYLFERDKRIRPDGTSQYIETKAEFSSMVEDPFLNESMKQRGVQPEKRKPLRDHVEVAIVGAGFGGLLAAGRLREAGFKDIRVIDKAGDFGGTWYWNRYPGAMCDVESYCYLPMLEELGVMPKHKYSFAPEIFQHCQRLAKHFDLYKNACLQTGVTSVSWQETDNCWMIETDRNDQFTASFIILANGPLSKPKLPGIPGIGSFRGHTFHTSRWDYAYTGGDHAGNLTGLSDKTVAIIGTGATAVQCIPALAKSAKQLYVFQRTPSSIDVRNNAETDPTWASTLPSGWQTSRMENFNTIVSGGDQDIDLVSDGWTDIFRNLTGMAVKPLAKKLGRRLTKAERGELLEISDYQKMNQIRSRVDEIVTDPKVAEALKPWYRQFCKRPCFHDEYLDSYNRSNVELVDTHGQGVTSITETGVVVAGQHYEVDCLIFATGFEVGTSYTRRAGYDIKGLGGQTLSENWTDGLRTYHGLQARGFPNCFFMGFTQSAVTVNVPHALNEQAKHLRYIMDQMRQNQHSRVDVSAQAEQDYVDEIKKYANVGHKFYSECTPGYYNSEGADGNKQGFFSEMYGAGSVKFFKLLRDWQDEGNMVGLELD